jgi:hypothetical protein
MDFVSFIYQSHCRVHWLMLYLLPG